MNQIQAIRMQEISQVRNLVAQTSGERAACAEAVQNARDTIQIMYREAAKFGLTKADVIRAILRPALGNRKSCNCPTCRSLRSRLGQNKSWYTSDT